VDLKHPTADPLLRLTKLPSSWTYYPMGLPVTVITNSCEVLDAAAESWGMYGPQYDREPVVLRVVTVPEGELAPEPVFRSQGHLLSIVSDRDNFACVDLRIPFAYCFVSQKTVSDHAWFRWFFLEPMAYMELAQRHVTPLHAGCVERNGRGILLCGASTAGKSTLAFACARAGWTFISDDATWLLQDSEDCVAIGKPHQARFREDAPQLFPELEGYITRARPNGKLSLEVPLSAFPEIQTSLRSAVSFLVFLERNSGCPAGFEEMDPQEAAGQLIQDACPYGEEVQARHERTIRRLVELPVHRLRYNRLEEALELLKQLVE
jgi:hypothetical protein